MLAIQKFWAFIKKYWGVAAIVVGAIVALFLFRKSRTDISAALQKLQATHDAEIARIDAIRAREAEEHRVNEQRYRETLAKIEDQYAQAKQEIDAKKRREVEDIVKRHGDDPVALADELHKATGFRVILPEQ